MNYPKPLPPEHVKPFGIFHTRENCGLVAYVPLKSGDWVKLSSADADRLQAFGLPCDDWYIGDDNAAPVVCAPSRNLSRVKVARVIDLIFGLSSFDRVQYREGGPLDLTRSNVQRWHDKEARTKYLAANAARRIEQGLPVCPSGLKALSASEGVAL
jgi:hypothetical protein